jgi:hypothetical protein
VNAESVDVWARVLVVLGTGGAALWLSIRLLWRLQGVIEARFEALLQRRSDDVARLENDLDAERRTCREEIAALRASDAQQKAEIAALRREIAALRAAGTGDRRHENRGRPDGGPERRQD